MSEWISVDDKYRPESGKVYLVYANDIVSSFIDTAACCKYPEYGNINWEDRDGEDYAPIVTHWMPLPKGP